MFSRCLPGRVYIAYEIDTEIIGTKGSEEDFGQNHDRFAWYTHLLDGLSKDQLRVTVAIDIGSIKGL